MARATFPERAERVLIAGMLIGIVLIMQRININLFKAGLSILVVSTLLQIAVGNIPKSGSVAGSLVRIVIILAVVALIFAIGILLVPTLSRMGR
jgi:hypothetical protein